MAFISIDLAGESKKYTDIRGVHLNETPIGASWAVYFDELLVNKVDMEIWTFLWYGECNAAPDFERVFSLLNADCFDELWGNRGVLVAINRRTNTVYLFNDCYGTFPVYYSGGHSSSGPVASTSIMALSREKVDWVSFYQFLSFGYVLGGYSLFEDVNRLKANSYLRIIVGSDNLSVSTHNLKNFWNSGSYTGKGKLDEIIDILSNEADGFDSTQIMMSGGWDSRLVLSVLEHKEPTLFTHGNLDSREIEIVRDIASFCRLKLTEQSFSDINFNFELFAKYLTENESAMFTHWSAAGSHAEKSNFMITAGTFGEVLGGHYGTLNALKGRKKYTSLLMHMLGMGVVFDRVLGLESPSVVINHLRMKSYGVFWFLNRELAEFLRSKELINESNERLVGIFRSYEEQGMDDAQTMFERFYTEHRGGQYINLQLTNASSGNNYRNIFTNKDLVEIISSIPFSYRAHNKLNKMLIKRMNPRLLDYPMAATLANASRPLLFQEGSRALRKLVESRPSLKTLYVNHSRYGDRGFGWNNFQDVVNGDFIRNLRPLLGASLWDCNKLMDAINANNVSNMYPLFDMISKAITLNYIVSND